MRYNDIMLGVNSVVSFGADNTDNIFRYLSSGRVLVEDDIDGGIGGTITNKVMISFVVGKNRKK